MQYVLLCVIKWTHGSFSLDVSRTANLHAGSFENEKVQSLPVNQLIYKDTYTCRYYLNTCGQLWQYVYLG